MSRNQLKFSLFWPALILGAGLLALDQWSKYWVDAFLPRMHVQAPWYPYRGIGLFSDFFGIEGSIVHTINRGAAWGVFADFQVPLLILRIVFVMGLAAYLFYFNQIRSRTVPLLLIVTGALSNIIDFFIYGHVVDMIHFVLWGYDYPVFNIADASIFVGVFWLAGISWLKPNTNDTRDTTPHTGS